jgi:hypothetical protein
MTIEEVSTATGITPKVFEDELGIAPADMGLKIKDLAATYGFDVETDFREFAERRLEALPSSTSSVGTSSAAPAGEAD